MIYGANGYTGELIARRAVEQGHRPILAGRGAAEVQRLANESGLDARVFSLESPAQIEPHLKSVPLVLNCAGPYSLTAAPLMNACLKAGCHYLDITGEIDVIETAAALDAQARGAGVAVLPAVGFDVVPTDCLAAMLAERLPGATHLQLAFAPSGGISPGTMRTMIQQFPSGGRARIDGQIRRIPVAWKMARIPFADRDRWAMTIPWGDVSSAFYSTGIPNIEVFAAAPRRRIRRLQWLRPLLPALSIRPLRKWIERRALRKAAGPSAAERQSGRTMLWGKVSDGNGKSIELCLTTPNGYELTVQSALKAVEMVLSADNLRGFRTPSQAFGKEFVLQLRDVAISERT
jgi:short subunit dehydrogenase-like uncharacterized protein